MVKILTEFLHSMVKRVLSLGVCLMKKKILIAVTSYDKYPSTERNAGLWFGELAHFYDIFTKEGYEVDIVSPSGGKIPIDPRSISILFLDKLSRSYSKNKPFSELLNNSVKPERVLWEDYALIFYAGGYGALWDISKCSKLQEISRNIYENGGIISALCHGVSGLLDIRLSNGTYLIKNKFITGCSNFEEILSNNAKYLPFSLQDELMKRGAHYKKSSIPLHSFAIQSGRVVTGQNPASVKAVTNECIKLLNNRVAIPCTAIY